MLMRFYNNERKLICTINSSYCATFPVTGDFVTIDDVVYKVTSSNLVFTNGVLVETLFSCEEV